MLRKTFPSPPKHQKEDTPQIMMKETLNEASTMDHTSKAITNYQDATTMEQARGMEQEAEDA